MIPIINFIILTIIFVYGFVARAVFRTLRERSKAAALVWGVFAVGAPLWLVWGYRFSASYDEYLAGCASDAGAHLVNPIPTDIPFVDSCLDARIILPNSGYSAIECIDNRVPTRFTHLPERKGLTKDGSELIQCQDPQLANYGALHIECFDRIVVDEISTPYNNDGFDVRTVESEFSAGILDVTETRFTLPDETLVAYIRHYVYLPYGNRRWLGITSGMPPRIQCQPAIPYPTVIDMFPPRPLSTR